MSKNRLEAFSDGVLAIIITIMILELGMPLGDKKEDLLALAPTLLGYLLSFMFLSIYWVNHHMIFHDATKINLKILWCNIIWLFIISFIPFATAWAGKYPNSFVPLTVYFADMALASIAFHVMYYLIECENGGKAEFKLDLRSIVSLIVYALAAGFGGFYVYVAYVLVAVVSLWWIIPAKKKIDKRIKSIIHKCPVCGEYEFNGETEDETCPICGWKYDNEIFHHDSYVNGKNLKEYIKDFKEKRTQNPNYTFDENNK